MTYAEWETAAKMTAEWIAHAEHQGDDAEAQRLRDTIWQLYDTIRNEEGRP